MATSTAEQAAILRDARKSALLRMRLKLFAACLIAGVLATVCLPSPTLAQAPYPSHPIRLIVPFPPGGPVDVMARFVVQRLGATLGQVIIDNRPGAGGTIGSKAAALAEPDGYTLLFGSSTTLAASPSLYRNIGYDPVKSFVPVGMISSVPFVLAVAPHVRANTLAELVAYAKANPGKLNFGAPTGTLPHLTGEMFKLRAGIDMVHIPYKGAASAITDVLSGEMDMTFEPISVMVAHVRDGKVRPLAVTSTERSPELPDVPTMIESGYPGFVSMSWTGIVAPAGTSPEVVAKLNRTIIETFRAKDAQEGLARMGAEPKFGTPESFGAMIAAEIPKWAEAVRAAGVRLD
jgi:tripartite-type tricarboxylate transporter receptor subunit TctC